MTTPTQLETRSLKSTAEAAGTTASSPDLRSIQKIARVAGILYLIITVAAIVAHMVMPSALFVPGDAAATAANLTASPQIFQLGIASELVVLLAEIVLSVLLYVLLKPVNQTLSLVAMVSRLAMTAVHGLNMLNYFFVVLLLGGASYLNVFAPEQLQALALLFIDAYDYGFALGIFLLTVHVAVLGYLIYKSGYFPKVLGILFMLASLGYLVDSVSLLLVPTYDTTPALIAMSIAAAEIAFPVWLLVKGVNAAGWQARVAETAVA